MQSEKFYIELMEKLEKISLCDVLPAVFASRVRVASDVWQCDTEFARGKAYQIVAESGTGKSSLCSFIYGYRTDFSGKITLGDKLTTQFSIKDWCDIRCRHISYLPQELRLFAELTAMENVALKNQITGHKTQKQIAELFEALGIADKQNEAVARLSIGQQQRVAIIRALCQPFDFIILDEPVSHLDEANNAVVARLVADEARAQGAGVIATSVGYNLSMNFDKTLKL